MKNNSLLFAASRNHHINWRWEKNNGRYPDYNPRSHSLVSHTASIMPSWVSAVTVLRHQDPRYEGGTYGWQREALLEYSDYYDCFFDWGAIVQIENIYLSYYLGNSLPSIFPIINSADTAKSPKLSDWHKKNFMELEIYLVDLDLWNIYEGTGNSYSDTLDIPGYTLLNKIKIFNTGMITQQNILEDCLCEKVKKLGMFQSLFFALKNCGYGGIAAPADFVSVFLDVSVFVTGRRKVSPKQYVRHIALDIPVDRFSQVAPDTSSQGNVYFSTPMYSDFRVRGFRNKIALTNTGKYPITLGFTGSEQYYSTVSDLNQGVLLKPGVSWQCNTIDSGRIFARSHYGIGKLSGMESMIGPSV